MIIDNSSANLCDEKPALLDDDDFWGVKHLPDALEVWGAVLPKSLEEITTAIAQWKTENRQVEIFAAGQGRVGSSYGYYALLASRKHPHDAISETIYILTAFTVEDCSRFAERHQIVHHL